MKNSKLIMMANQITDFFKSYPEEKAIQGITAHLKSFWTEEMIIELDQDYKQDQDHAKLHHLCIEALKQLK